MRIRVGHCIVSLDAIELLNRLLQRLVFLDEGIHLEFTSIDLLTLFQDCISFFMRDDDDTIFIRNVPGIDASASVE